MDFIKQNKQLLFGCSVATFATFAGVFALEHIGKKKNWTTTPSDTLMCVARYSSKF